MASNRYKPISKLQIFRGFKGIIPTFNEVEKAQLELLISLLWRNLLLGSILAPVCIAILVDPYVTSANHLYWLWAAALIALFRSVLTYIAIRCYPENTTASWFLILALLYSAALIWPLSIFIYLTPENSEDVLLYIIFVLMAVLSGATVSFSFHSWAFYGYLLGSIIPVMAALIYIGEAEHYRIIAAMSIYCLSMIYFSRLYSSRLKEQVAHRVLNQTLMDQYRLEKELAQKAQQDKSRFLASASHDLRQPLHALTMFVSLLQRKLEGKYEDITQPISNSVSDLSTLLSALLDTSRLDSGDIKVKPEPVDIAGLLGSIASEFRPLAQAKGLSFKAHIREFEIVTDPVLLSAIVRNLLENAVKYTESGGVLLSCRQLGKSLHIQVWDTGLGIEKRHRALIFQEFTQIGNPGRDKSKGVGLGLANACKMSELIGAKLNLRSEFNQGSVFTLVHPLDSLYSRLPSSAVLPEEFISLQGVRILLVDDDRAVLQATQYALEYHSATVFCACDRSEAIAVIARQEVDIIVTDYRLGIEVTGLELAQQLNTVWGLALPILVVSGEIEESVRQDVESHNASLISKPIDDQQLAGRILKLLS